MKKLDWPTKEYDELPWNEKFCEANRVRLYCLWQVSRVYGSKMGALNAILKRGAIYNVAQLIDANYSIACNKWMHLHNFMNIGVCKLHKATNGKMSILC